MRLSYLAVAAVLLLTGCNTYYQNQYQTLLVRTPGVENAYCHMYTQKNQYLVLSTRHIIVDRSRYPLTVLCEKDGYYTASVIVQSHFSAPYAPMNIANGFVGATYDTLSNSIFAYPDTITLILLPKPPQKLPPEHKPYVVKELEPAPAPAPAPVKSAPPPAAADKSLNKSLQK
ncbi:MAG: hypothetical protein KGL10_02530 [Alphaproteobacteria bacterium]|nr:hypothetical protein [Alphaproteobacteria bacterium]MDE2336165.1 hypothetical protein [Alphaproteobacteria bacterium]